MIYCLIIGLPVLLAYCADKTKGALNVILTVAALFVPCFFAGVRDETVGTDVLTYGIWTFNAAEAQGFTEFMHSYAAISAPGFNLLSWIMGRTGSFELYLGSIQALTVCPLYLYVRRRYRKSTWSAMAIYMLLLFPISLNAMKQMIAVSFCLTAYELIERKKFAKFTIYILIIALLFHQTAVVFLVAYPIIRLLYGMHDGQNAFFGKVQGLITWTIIAALFFIAFVFGNLLIELIAPIKDSYSYQLQASGSRLNYSALVMTAVLIATYLIWRPKNRANGSGLSKEQAVLASVSIIGSIAFQLNIIATSLLRFAYYFVSFLTLYIPSLMKDSAGKAARRSAWILLIFFVFYFVQVYVINGGNAVYPYTSVILGVG
ncbi:EpsG family protein [Olsenella sp. kh2p3]|uniref:EpsG family protein n=1 Tax=Olsenella sp. kh2p3 TaxID=1797112 RepID=UPI00090F210C|nr:EpsG family protein [Olsenella sp. kh2p3]SFX42597.1 EpsG family protein [Olsenella sp. kh2p3]